MIGQNTDVESHPIQQQHEGQTFLVRGDGQLDPRGAKDHTKPIDELEVLSRIIQELNNCFGNFTEEDKVLFASWRTILLKRQSL